MMDVISSAYLFYEFSPKRKWYSEKFLNYYGERIGVTEVQRKKISLARSRWVERNRAFESYYLLYRANVAVMESIFKPNYTASFMMHYAPILKKNGPETPKPNQRHIACILRAVHLHIKFPFFRQ